jgi:hypothetical protein
MYVLFQLSTQAYSQPKLSYRCDALLCVVTIDFLPFFKRIDGKSVAATQAFSPDRYNVLEGLLLCIFPKGWQEPSCYSVRPKKRHPSDSMTN